MMAGLLQIARAGALDGYLLSSGGFYQTDYTRPLLLWYQIPPFNGNASADLMVVITMAVLSAALVVVPFLPVVRSIPRWVPVHRLIWRDYYRGGSAAATPTGGSGSPPVTSGK
jgi:hypothetical protein